MDETAHTGFRDRRIQPLCHLSGGAQDKLEELLPLRREEGPQQVGAVVGEQSALDLGAVVQAGLVEHVEHAAGGARLRIRGAVHQAGEARDASTQRGN